MPKKLLLRLLRAYPTRSTLRLIGDFLRMACPVKFLKR
jgi:hypothetical protein